MLRYRLLAAALIIAPLVALLVLDYRCGSQAPGIWLAPLPLVVAAMGAAELLALFRAQDLRPVPWSVQLGTLAVVAASLIPIADDLWGAGIAASGPAGQMGWIPFGFALALAIAFAAEMRRFREPGQATAHVAFALLIVAYLGLLMAFLMALRRYHDNAWGMSALVSLILVTKMSDTGAYVFGHLVGRTPMTPRLSPKKTWEGGVGGLVTACACSWAYFAWVNPWIVRQPVDSPELWRTLLYGLVIGVAGILGDLSESLLKRDMQRKDSSRWLPGLGGVLDVLDSLTFAAPAAWLCWLAGLVGPR